MTLGIVGISEMQKWRLKYSQSEPNWSIKKAEPKPRLNS
jgi:hypothetical protein